MERKSLFQNTPERSANGNSRATYTHVSAHTLRFGSQNRHFRHAWKSFEKGSKTRSRQLNRHERFMQAAIRYARRHISMTGPNPSVACLIVAGKNDGQWIAGRGVTAIGGRPHAETQALDEAGKQARNATAYVTLEPCSHYGVTPPCAKELIEAGIACVVVAQPDPDSRVNASGLGMLRNAGVKVVEHVYCRQASWGIRGYLSRKARSRPWVMLKLAVTSDGYLGMRGAGQIAITGPIANDQTHMARANADAILVGSGTAIADDPLLTCRLPGLGERSPIRIVLESSRFVPRDCNLIKTASETATFIACPETKLALRKRQLAGTSCKFIACSLKDKLIFLPELLTRLADNEISFLMVEGGGKIAEEFLSNQLVDEIVLYVGGKKMADRPESRKHSEWVASPVPPDAGFQGFHIASQHQYGPDRAIRMVRN